VSAHGQRCAARREDGAVLFAQRTPGQLRVQMLGWRLQRGQSAGAGTHRARHLHFVMKWHLNRHATPVTTRAVGRVCVAFVHLQLHVAAWWGLCQPEKENFTEDELVRGASHQ